MANGALAALESALRDRKLDRTLTTGLPAADRIESAACAAVALDRVDEYLRGGLPRGQLCELAGPPSAGRTTLLLHVIAAATRRGELAVLIDPCDRLDVASALTAGVDLDRLLWVRGDVSQASAHGLPARALVERTLDRALKALNLVLQAGGFGIVALDVADIPVAALKRLPFTTWLRVQRIVEGTDTACVLVVPEPLARSAGGVTLMLGARPGWAGTAVRSRRLDRLAIAARAISPRRRVDGEVRFDAMAADAQPRETS
jgi:hypothetical protein